jgi:hypothetical protein
VKWGCSEGEVEVKGRRSGGVANLVVVDHGAEGFRVQGLPSEGEVVVALSLHLPQHCRGKGRGLEGRR